MASAERQLRAKFAELRALSRDFGRWESTPVGADLWVDGIDAVRNTPPSVFDAYVSALLELHRTLGRSTPLQLPTMREYLLTVDTLLAFCAQRQEEMWPALAAGICVVHCCGGPPQLGVIGHELTIVNDTLMLLLSPTYRAIRFNAFNVGVTVQLDHGSAPDWFYPETRSVRFGEKYFVAGDVSRIQHYNVTHDLAHIVYFADCYIAVGGSSADFSLLLNAEEFCCGIDLVLMSEIRRRGLVLNVMKEFRGVEPLDQPRTPMSVAEKACRNRRDIRRYQRGLRAVAQRISGADNDVARELLERGADCPDDIHGWVSTGAIDKHIRGTRDVQRRANGKFAVEGKRELSLCGAHMRNLQRAVVDGWSSGSVPLGLLTPELCQSSRDRNVAANSERTFFLLNMYSKDVNSTALHRLSPAALLNDIESRF